MPLTDGTLMKNHPKGLRVLFMIEMWERFGFYIMSAIYVLYMDKDLKFDDSTKGNFYSAFLGAAYLFPLVGGWLGDKVLGTFKTVRTGQLMMITGYVFLAVSSINALLFFYIGLFMVAAGTGIFKVNMSVLVGNLYHDKRELKDAGFSIYYMGVNIGAAAGPLTANIIGMLTNNYNLSFWSAAIGMILAITIFELGKGKLIAVNPKKTESENNSKNKNIRISRSEFRERVIILIVLFCIAAMFWVPFYQSGFALTLFADRSTMKVSWLRPEVYVTFGAIFILLLTPPLLWIFSKLHGKGKEPSTPVKIFYGMTATGLSMLVMVAASLFGGNDNVNIMSPMWLIASYFLITIAEILISPMGQSYVTKVAPPSIQGFMMGGWFSATAIGAISAGLFGKIYNSVSHHEYFLILTGLSFLAAILALSFTKKLKKYAG